MDGHIWYYDTDRLHFAYLDNGAPVWHHNRADNQARLHDSNRMRGTSTADGQNGGAA